MNPSSRGFAQVGLGFLLLTAHTNAASLTALGVLPSDNPRSFATAVTPDGKYVVGYANSGTGSEAFRWSQTSGMVGLGDLEGGEFRSEAYSIADDGTSVFGAAFPGFGMSYEPFQWTPTQGLTRLGDGPPPGLQASSAVDASSDGQVVVGGALDSTGLALPFRWTADGGYKSLTPLPPGAVSGGAAAVSSDGRTVAGYLESSGSRTEGFRWTEESGVLGLGKEITGRTVITEVYGLSADGRFITGLVRYDDTGNLEMFRWSASEGMLPLGHLPKGEARSIGFGITANGQMIVGEATMEIITPGLPFPMRIPRAAVWYEGTGLRPLWDVLVEAGVNPAADGWGFLATAKAVSPDGRFVVGVGDHNGRPEAFIADLAQRVELTRIENRWQLSWPNGFKLQQSVSLNPPSWADVPGASSPWEMTLTEPAAYFRALRNP